MKTRFATLPIGFITVTTQSQTRSDSKANGKAHSWRDRTNCGSC